MHKQPFTQAGFLALQAQLYQLNDTLLQLEADAIALNFEHWFFNHLDVSLNQLSFLNEISPKALSFIAKQTSFAVANRLPVSLLKDEEEGDKTGKVIKTKSSFTVTAGSDGQMVVEGELLLQIYYVS